MGILAGVSVTVRPSPQKGRLLLISSLPALEKAEASRVFPFLALYRSVECTQDFHKPKYLLSLCELFGIKFCSIFGIMASSLEERHGRTRILAGIGT